MVLPPQVLATVVLMKQKWSDYIPDILNNQVPTEKAIQHS